MFNYFPITGSWATNSWTLLKISRASSANSKSVSTIDCDISRLTWKTSNCFHLILHLLFSLTLLCTDALSIVLQNTMDIRSITYKTLRCNILFLVVRGIVGKLQIWVMTQNFKVVCKLFVGLLDLEWYYNGGSVV